MKKKINKKLLARIGAILACVLLVGALAIPCFADEATTYASTDGAKNAFMTYYDIASDSPLRYLLNSNVPTEWGMELAYCFQFSGVLVGSQIAAPELLTYDFNNYTQLSFTAVKNLATGVTSELGVGYWTTNYTSSGDSRIIFFKFNEYLDGEPRVALQLRVAFDVNTYAVTSSTITSSVYPIDGDYDDFIIGSISNVRGSAPLLYSYTCGFADFTVAADYIAFENGYGMGIDDGELGGYEYGYDVGYDVGHDAGYEEGEAAGTVIGYQQGWSDGHSSGYEAGLKDNTAYDQGYADGEQSSEGYQNGYDEGYSEAVRQIDSGEFGENLLGNVFSVPMKALREFVLVELPNGTEVTLMGLLSAVLALILFLAFLKVYAGG